MLIEQVTSDKVKREGIIEGHGGTNTALSYSCVACVHTHAPREEEGENYWDPE